ncbi:IclR family transcriptional regulator [Candidimonas nitroreducens]|uniref:IclR family transcriptional regulator n=1 Tax=Candidimonas nitroreducens TaxID=683354 RepID=A0A225M260_9BURK|nr:IclR family transcriptional regulator [Candidimonas nitroreducens]OWT55206.1 IclR family transcriptional regulator [Candidimonas nitroreducens]
MSKARPAATATDPSFATTLAHGFSVLECFRTSEPLLSNKDLVARTGLSKATISRLTYTLALRGLLNYDAELRRYRLGSRVLSLGYPLLAGIPVRQQARPIMRRLAAATGGTVSLGVRHGTRMVYIETNRSHDLASFRPDLGASLPLLATAMGRAWLCGARHGARAQALDLLRAAQAGLPDPDEIFHAAREQYGRLGYCVSEGAWFADVHAVAVPLDIEVNEGPLILNCGITVARLDGRPIADVAGRDLLRAAADVARLGGAA